MTVDIILLIIEARDTQSTKMGRQITSVDGWKSGNRTLPKPRSGEGVVLRREGESK
jgi:hypothetical protein